MQLALVCAVGLFIAAYPYEVANGATVPSLASACPDGACQNSGICVNTENGIKCKCLPGYTGQYCEELGSPCQPNPCFNSGICTYANFEDGGVEVKCHCPVGYSGTLCEFDLNNICVREEPCVHGYCMLLTQNSYYCICEPGYQGEHCNITDICIYGPCKNGATCSSSIESYECFCKLGFYGKNCTEDVDECSRNVSICGEGTCQNTDGSYHCYCPNGYTGAECSEKVIPCQSSSCLNGASCEITGAHDYTCHCLPGFTGQKCELFLNGCNNTLCRNGGSCISTQNCSRCECTPGYTGPTCELDVNECLEQSDVCRNGGTCLNKDGDYHCLCSDGWTGKNCESKKHGYEGCKCFNGGSCHEMFGKYICKCPGGYTGIMCNLRDRCFDNPCSANSTCVLNPADGSYNCICPSGSTGVNCTEDINECDQDLRCVNQASCVNELGSYHCLCPPGRRGQQCELDVDDCASVPCKNNGACQHPAGGHICDCEQGSTGAEHETIPVNCSMDNGMNPDKGCLNGGNCIIEDADGYCVCSEGYFGDYCEQMTGPCLSNPCSTQSTCVSNRDKYKCLCQAGFTGVGCQQSESLCPTQSCCLRGSCIEVPNTQEKFRCVCLPCWTSWLCDSVAEECPSQPCWYNATGVNVSRCCGCHCKKGTFVAVCHRMKDHLSNSTLHDQRSRSLLNVSKRECKTRYASRNHETLHNSTEVARLNGGNRTDMASGLSCRCPSGNSGTHCGDLFPPIPCFNECNCSNISDINHCELSSCTSSSCQHGGVCVNEKNSFKCLCPEGYTGRRCELIVDNCLLLSPCLNEGTCVTSLKGYECHCPSQFKGRRCERPTYDCGVMQCWNGGSCEKYPYGIMCQCLPGFTGNFCELEIDECASSPCQNNGTCHDYVNSYTCTCPPGFSGLACEVNSEDCSPTTCLNGGQCIDGLNNYSCICERGYAGRNCQHQLHSCACKNDGTCIDFEDFSFCRCAPGYAGAFCEETVNRCARKPCKNGGVCIPQEGGFYCECPNKWTGSTCEIEMISCQEAALKRNVSQLALCNGGRCVDRADSHMCFCPFGFTGPYCESRIPHCRSNPCLNGVCEDQSSGFICHCLPGYSGSTCEFKTGSCQSTPCQNLGTCHVVGNGYVCSCPHGTSGKNCEIDFDDCYPGICYHNGTCVDKVGGFDCTCPPGFVGRRCEGDVNECLSIPCSPEGSVSCFQMDNNFSCVCRSGYTGRSCDVPFDFCSQSPCKNNAICINALQVCVCQQGYKGEFCDEKVVEACRSNPCHNGGDCIAGRSPFELYFCDCLAGTTGKHCEHKYLTNCLVNGCSNGGTCENHMGAFVCHCHPRFTGAQCHLLDTSFLEDVGIRPHIGATALVSNGFNDSNAKYICYMNKCQFKANNGFCNPECNSYLCNFDGIDCAGDLEPFRQCSNQEYCANVFKNGICDPQCNDEDCLFDGFDCFKVETDYYFQDFDQHCGSHAADDNCNEECNKTRYSFDGGDCLTDKQRDSEQLEGQIAALVAVSPARFEIDLGRFLMVVGNLAQVIVRVETDENGRKMIYQWNLKRGSMSNELTTGRLRTRSVGTPSAQAQPAAAECIRTGGSGTSSPSGSGAEGKRNKNEECTQISDKLLLAWIKGNFRSDLRSCSLPSEEPEDGLQKTAITSSKECLNNLLFKAARGPFSDDQVQCAIIDELISSGADVNYHDGPYRFLPLIYAAKYKNLAAARCLLKRGANPNLRDVGGRTALHHAISVECEDIVELLLDLGQCDLELEDTDGCTAVLLVTKHCKEGCSIFSRLVDAGASLLKVDNGGRSCTHWAAYNNNVTILALLWSKNAMNALPDELGRTALFWAASENCVEAVRFLDDCGFDRQALDQYNRSPIDVAMNKGHLRVVALLRRERPGTAEFDRTSKRKTEEILESRGSKKLRAQERKSWEADSSQTVNLIGSPSIDSAGNKNSMNETDDNKSMALPVVNAGRGLFPPAEKHDSQGALFDKVMKRFRSVPQLSAASGSSELMEMHVLQAKLQKNVEEGYQSHLRKLRTFEGSVDTIGECSERRDGIDTPQTAVKPGLFKQENQFLGCPGSETSQNGQDYQQVRAEEVLQQRLVKPVEPSNFSTLSDPCPFEMFAFVEHPGIGADPCENMEGRANGVLENTTTHPAISEKSVPSFARTEPTEGVNFRACPRNARQRYEWHVTNPADDYTLLVNEQATDDSTKGCSLYSKSSVRPTGRHCSGNYGMSSFLPEADNALTNVGLENPPVSSSYVSFIEATNILENARAAWAARRQHYVKNASSGNKQRYSCHMRNRK